MLALRTENVQNAAGVLPGKSPRAFAPTLRGPHPHESVSARSVTHGNPTA